MNTAHQVRHTELGNVPALQQAELKSDVLSKEQSYKEEQQWQLR